MALLSLDQGSQALPTGPGVPPAPGWGLEGAPSQSPQHVGAAGRARAAIWTLSVLLGPSVCPDSLLGCVSARLGLCLFSLLFPDSCCRQSGGGRCLGHLAPGTEQPAPVQNLHILLPDLDCCSLEVCPCSLNSIYYRQNSAEFLQRESSFLGWSSHWEGAAVPKLLAAGSKPTSGFQELLLQVEKFL